MPFNQAAHITELACALLDDVELSRLPAEQLLLKASRLARLVEDADVGAWLRYELDGYPGTMEARSYALRFGRVESADAAEGYWLPLAGLSGLIASMQTQIQQLKVPNIQFAPSSANPDEFVTGFAGLTVSTATAPAQAVLERLQLLTTAVSNLAAIRSRVLNAVHEFATRVYYQRAFAGLAETIFDRHKALVDGVVAVTATEVVKKLPAIYDRLAAGDPEAVSQALNSVRRMIKAFADAVYPPGEGTRELEGQQYEIGSDKVLNRIKLYLNARCNSRSRCERLNRTLRDLYDRASAGAHSDVTADEARALFLHTYLTIGEVITAGTDSGSSSATATPGHVPEV